MKYRPEVDGLRTVAILSVLLYHAELFVGGTQLFQGGFLGVDVFFVISGYLITSLILAEYRSFGTFSFGNFFERRARRLMPALLLVILISLPVAWVMLLPSALIDFSKSILASTFFVSNFYWMGAMAEYGAESALLRPFLHTWTLGVEMQFYFIFSVIFFFLYQYLRKHALVILAALLLLSFEIAEFTNGKYSAFAFYMFPTRFWELMVGGILAYVMINHPLKTTDTLAHRLLPILGIFLIAHSVMFVELNDNHPGVATLGTIIGTVFIIWFAGKKELVTEVLSSGVFVTIGVASYSLYLWHYPIFAFGRMMSYEPSIYEKAGWLILTGILSFASYKLVEKPLRNRKRVGLRQFTLIIMLSISVIGGYAAYAIHNDGVKERFGKLANIYGKNEFDNRILRNKYWNILDKLAEKDGYRSIPSSNPIANEHEKKVNWFSDNPQTKKILIVGASHAIDTFNALYQNKELFAGLEFARYGMIVEMIKDPSSNILRELVSSPNFRNADIILISNRYRKNKKSGHYEIGLPIFLQRIIAEGKTVFVASNTVEFEPNRNRRTIFDQIIRSRKKLLQSSSLSMKEISKTMSMKEISKTINEQYFLRQKPILTHSGETPDVTNAKVRKIAEEHGAIFLDKFDYICDEVEKTCDGITPDGYKVFFDYGHHTLEGAKHFGKKIHAINWLGLETPDPKTTAR